MSDKINYNYKTLSTNDNFLRLRAILLNIPIILKNNSMGVTDVSYTNQSNEVIPHFQKYYADSIKNLNNSVKEQFLNIINKNSLIYNNKRIIINNKIKRFFEEIINEIDNKNQIIDKVDYKKFKTLEEYSLHIFKYQAIYIFGEKDVEYILYNNNAVYLFPGIQENTDIFFNKGMKVDKYIETLIGKIGGSKNNTNSLEYYDINNPLYNIDINNYDTYRNKINKLMDNGEESDALQLCLFYNLSKIEKKQYKLYNDLEILYNCIYPLFYYTSKTVVNDLFIIKLIELYNKDELHKLSFDNYERLLKEWYKTVRDPEDDPFEGFVEEEMPSTKNKSKIKTKKRHYKNITTNNNIINPVINNTPISYNARSRCNRGKIEKRPPVDNSMDYTIGI